MSIYIEYTRDFDDIIFKLWLNHYEKTNIECKIYVKADLWDFFESNYPFSATKMIRNIPINACKITEKDFLFAYSRDQEDNMILSYQIDPCFANTIQIIGRVFYVPVKDKRPYTTFEIPDFILYKHADHTNYTKDGILVLKQDNCDGNTNNEIPEIPEIPEISKNIVCLNLNVSPFANEYEYYETNILISVYNNLQYIIFQNVYNVFSMNINICKEHKYGIIWHPKCGCTTITHIFCLLNNIELPIDKQKSVCYHLKKYRYHSYLQNITFISFERNPYHRFISTFLDKHVYKTDSIYLILDGYTEFMKQYKIETIENIVSFLSNNGYISEHFTLMSRCPIYTNKKHKYTCIKMDSGLNAHLYDFLKQYYTNIDDFDIQNMFENVKDNKRGKKESLISDSFAYDEYGPAEWESYLKEYNINYDMILNSKEFAECKKKLYEIYQEDFQMFGYE